MNKKEHGCLAIAGYPCSYWFYGRLSIACDFWRLATIQRCDDHNKTDYPQHYRTDSPQDRLVLEETAAFRFGGALRDADWRHLAGLPGPDFGQLSGVAGARCGGGNFWYL